MMPQPPRPNEPKRIEFCTIKCGGSLLSLPDLAERLLNLIDEAQLGPAVVIVGGGQAADLVRDWDRQFGLSAHDAHTLAIQAMSLNARLLCALQKRFFLMASADEIVEHADGRIGVLDVAKAVPLLEQTHPPLLESWDVTSDSIAAWFATACRSQSLLLLKSVDLPRLGIPNPNVIRLLSEQSLVDPQFEECCRNVPSIQWCNLSRSRPVIQTVR